ncbi:MAG: hypothetical protein NZ898_09130 [Myxococcota bacterium]|nr:hypothetical protein [Myxococcota bacterium]MDW8364088.1 hypothetical protein [Myxococcales bacterium]
MSVRKALIERGMKVLQDPRVARMMQDPRVMKAMMRALELRAKLQAQYEQQVARVARTMNLATQKELQELRRSLRKLERALDEARTERTTGGAAER